VGIDKDKKITEFLPELDDNSSLIPWNEISLAALSEHLSGIPPNCELSWASRMTEGKLIFPDGFSEYYNLKDVFEHLGLPHIEESEYLNCGVIALNPSCTRDRKLSYIALKC
jgi:hypothetical protein